MVAAATAAAEAGRWWWWWSVALPSFALVPKPLCSSLVFSGCTEQIRAHSPGACVDTGNRKGLCGFWQETASEFLGCYYVQGNVRTTYNVNCTFFGHAFACVCGYYATRPEHANLRLRRWPYRQGSVAFFGRIRRPGGSAREAAPPSTHTQYTTKVRAELNSRIYENRACTCRHTRWTSVRPSPRSSSPPRLPLRVVRVVCR